MKPDLMGTLNWLQSLSQQMVLNLHMQLKMVLKVPEDGRLYLKILLSLECWCHEA